jgi:hypothetical protein
MATRIVPLVALLWSVLLLPGCGGGGGGNGGAPPPPVNRPPVAAISGPASGEIDVVAAFDGVGSSDPDGDPLSYRWTMEVPAGSRAWVNNASTSRVTVIPDIAGEYRLRLVVSDGRLDSTPAEHVLSVSPPSPIQATLRSPAADALVPSAVAVVVTIVSTYEVHSVTATLAGSEQPGFSGTLSLAGQPPGRYTLTVVAIDVRDNTDQYSIEVTHDNPPQLSVLAPLDRSVALPMLAYEASCSDDLPGCTVELMVNNQSQLSAPALLAGQLDMSAWLGRQVRIVLRAHDSAGQVTELERAVFAENGARLAVVTEVPGPIVHVDEQHLLYVEPGDAGDRLVILDRISGLTEQIPLPAGRTIHADSAFLIPTGAIFVAEGSGGLLSSRVYLWSNGLLTDLAYPNSTNSLVVSGNYAIWNEATKLYRVDTSSGLTTLIASNTGNWLNSVTADGTVVFWSTSYQIVRDVAGVQTILASDPILWHVYPLTDGPNVVYRKSDPCCSNQQYSIEFLDGSGVHVLAAMRSAEPQPLWDYQINSGWVAYTDLGNLGQLHVFTRSPLGDTVRHTDFGTTSHLDYLAGNGELMLANSQQRYFSRGTGLLAISSAAGRGYWLDGVWYVAIGRALLRADTAG